MRHTPSFESTTKLVARALGIEAEKLLMGVRVATLSDLSAIVAFRLRHIREQIRWDDTAYLKWRYGLGRDDFGLGDLWVFELGDRLLGIVGAEDMGCFHAGQHMTGTRTMDILIDESVRHTGLGIWLNQAMFRKGAFTLAVGANENSIGTVKRLFRLLP
ncbi:MAG: hypothetical protein ABL931_12945, partial [Usitatibacteraceae bacterium]